MTLYRALDDQSGAGLALTVLGGVAFAEGEPARAERLFDENEEFLRVAGSRWNLAANLSIRAVTTAMRGDHAQSIALLRESLALALRLHDTQMAAYTLEGLSGASAMLGEGQRSALRRSGSVARAVRIRDRTRHLARAARASPGGAAGAVRRGRFGGRVVGGRAITFEQAVEYALEDDDLSSSSS